MKLRFMDMINHYIEREKERLISLAEKEKRPVLEEFAFFLDRRKNPVWRISDITEDDGKAYYASVTLTRLSTGKTREKGGVYTAKRRMEVLNHFMSFAQKQGWIEKRPWEHLFERKKGGRFKLKEVERVKLFNYLKEMKARDFFAMRDKAMLMIYLQQNLYMTEISRLNKADYTGKTLSVKSSCAWRERSIELSGNERQSLDEYLRERERKGEAPDEEALFIGHRRKRITFMMVKYTLETYLERIREGKQ